MTMEHFIILSVIGMGIVGILNCYIAYLSFRLLSLTKAILQETITIRKDTKGILAETIIIREETVTIREVEETIKIALVDDFNVGQANAT